MVLRVPARTAGRDAAGSAGRTGRVRRLGMAAFVPNTMRRSRAGIAAYTGPHSC